MKISEVGIDNGYAITRGWVSPEGAGAGALISGITDGTTLTDTPQLLEFTDTVIDLGDGVTLVASSWKIPVRCATTVAGTLASSFAAGSVVDGITLATADRILVKNQTGAYENGIYTVNATGAPSRSLDLGLSALVPGAVVDVKAGTTNAASLWMCTNQTDPVLDTDAITFALVNGAGVGNFELSISGGQSIIKAHGSMGSTETFTPADGNVHTGTLDADCTFTLGSPSGSGACLLEIRALQDGTGGRTITWPGSVSWQDGTPAPTTTAATTWVYIVETTDGGSSWIGRWGGASSSSTGVTDGAHAHVAGETHLSDGSTTTYTLDEAFEPGSVEAFNTTTLAYLTVTEAQPDQATVSAAGTTGDKITFSYAGTLV